MAKTRIATSKPIIPSREEAMAAQNEYSAAFVKQIETEAVMESEIQSIREKFQLEFTEIGEIKAEKLKIINLWAEANKDLFVEKRSMDWGNAVIGYRYGTPKVIVRPGTKNPDTGKAVTLKEIALQLDAEKMFKFIKISEPALDKNTIAATLKEKKSDEAVRLSAIGLALVQEESFFIDVKIESIDV